MSGTVSSVAAKLRFAEPRRLESRRPRSALLALEDQHGPSSRGGDLRRALAVGAQRQAEDEGLREVFESAGFEWRRAGCSMCLGMNPDVLSPGERCASTSNRNFEGRQGAGGRTHLLSPAMAAAAAVHGHFADVRELA